MVCLLPVCRQSATTCPETKDTLTDELFSEAEVILARVSLNVELTERYALPRYCELIGDDYALLNMKEKTEEETE